MCIHITGEQGANIQNSPIFSLSSEFGGFSRGWVTSIQFQHLEYQFGWSFTILSEVFRDPHCLIALTKHSNALKGYLKWLIG